MIALVNGLPRRIAMNLALNLCEEKRFSKHFANMTLLRLSGTIIALSDDPV